MTDADLAPGLRAALAGEPLHRELRSMVRRRVPASEVEDVVQSVLCDALAAQRVPPDPADIPRWVMAIARHKVADVHRRSNREEPTDVVEAVAPRDPHEERDLLRAVIDSVRQESAKGAALRWAVREYGGDRLSDIADEERLPRELVRQRVSRLRRELRARWLLAAAAILGAAMLAAHFGGSSQIVADSPFGTVKGYPTNRALVAKAEARPYRVASTDFPEGYDPAFQQWIEMEAQVARVEWEGEYFRVVSPSREIRARVIVARGPDGLLAGTLLTTEGKAIPVVIEAEGDRPTVRLGGSLGGVRIVLAR